MGTVFRLSVGGQEYSPVESGGSLVYSGTPLGTVTISLAGTGFTVTCQGGTENTEAIVDVLVRYYAKVTGNANDITNSVSLSVDGTLIKEDSQTIRRYDNQGLVATKSIPFRRRQRRKDRHKRGAEGGHLPHCPHPVRHRQHL